MARRAFPDRPLVGVGVVVLRDWSVLLIRRARAPLLGALSFPGGGQRLGETVEATGRRELMEETGVEAGPLRLAAHVDAIDRDENGAIRFHYTILDLAGRWLGGEPRAGGDVSEAFFAPIERLGAVGLDDAHQAVVRSALSSAGCSDLNHSAGASGWLASDAC